MEEMMDTIIEFLNDTFGDNYVYVLGIGAIVLFMLIGFLASRKGSKKKEDTNKEEPMANINEINTGEINQVAENLQQQKVEPVDIASAPTSDALVVDKEPVVPVNQEVVPPTNINNVPGGIPQQPSGLNVEPEKPLGNGINQQPLNQNNIGNTEKQDINVADKPQPLRFEDFELSPPSGFSGPIPSVTENKEPVDVQPNALGQDNKPEGMNVNQPMTGSNTFTNVDYHSNIPNASPQNFNDVDILHGEETPVENNENNENKPL